MTTERRALLVTTPVAAGAKTTGASLRADEALALLTDAHYSVVRCTPATLPPAGVEFDLAVAVSYACASAVPALRQRAARVWLDAVDSWMLVNASGLLRRDPTYAFRAARDAYRLALMPRVDLVTYISAADLRQDYGTVRGLRTLVLPWQPTPVSAAPRAGSDIRLVLAGDWTYAPNTDGLRWFTRRVLPRLRPALECVPWQVVVFGTGSPRLGQGHGLTFAGYQADAAQLYREGDVHVAPIRSGAGVKRKVVQPLLAGLPVVTTRSGGHGLRPHPLLDVSGSAEEFATTLARRVSTPTPTAPVDAQALVDADDREAVAAWLTESGGRGSAAP
jgi:hypothetical protein